MPFNFLAPRVWLSWFRLLVFLPPKTLNSFVFPIFWLWATWWRLLQKHVAHTNLDIYVLFQFGLFLFFCFMVFNATFNNISTISWRSVLLVVEYPEKTIDLSQVTDKLYHIMLYTLPWAGVEHTTSEVIGTDCIDSCKSNYLTITATTTPLLQFGICNVLLHFYNQLVTYCLYCFISGIVIKLVNY